MSEINVKSHRTSYLFCMLNDIPHIGTELKKAFDIIKSTRSVYNTNGISCFTGKFKYLLLFKLKQQLLGWDYKYTCRNGLCFRSTEPKYKYENGVWLTNVKYATFNFILACCDRCTPTWNELSYHNHDIEHETDYEEEYASDQENEDECLRRYKRTVADGECTVCYESKKLYSFFKTCNHTVCFDCFVQFNDKKCVFNCCSK